MIASIVFMLLLCLAGFIYTANRAVRDMDDYTWLAIAILFFVAVVINASSLMLVTA